MRELTFRAGWRLHRWVRRVSGGRLGGRAVGMPVLELTTIGRRSGMQRSVLLTYLEHPDGFVVVASNIGRDHHPAWWLNLMASPEATVVVDGLETPVRARELVGEEREQWWSRLVEANRGYSTYASRTERAIPVVLLAHRPG